MSKVNLAVAVFIIAIAPVSMISWAVSVEKKTPVKKVQVSDEATLRDYNAFIRMDVEEMEETKGKVGPLVTGAIGALGGAGTSIATDVIAGNDINWTNAGINAGAGFVGGLTGNVLGGASGLIAGSALGVSALGALSAAFSSGSGECSTCHNRFK